MTRDEFVEFLEDNDFRGARAECIGVNIPNVQVINETAVTGLEVVMDEDRVHYLRVVGCPRICIENHAAKKKLFDKWFNDTRVIYDPNGKKDGEVIDVDTAERYVVDYLRDYQDYLQAVRDELDEVAEFANSVVNDDRDKEIMEWLLKRDSDTDQNLTPIEAIRTNKEVDEEDSKIDFTDLQPLVHSYKLTGLEIVRLDSGVKILRSKNFARSDDFDNGIDISRVVQRGRQYSYVVLENPARPDEVSSNEEIMSFIISHFVAILSAVDGKFFSFSDNDSILDHIDDLIETITFKYLQ